MRRLVVAILPLALIAGACFGGDKTTPAMDLTQLAASADGVEYSVTYAFSQQGELDPGSRHVFEIVQDAPDYLRRTETATFDDDGKTLFTQMQWYVYSGGEFRTCFSINYPEDEPVCRVTPAPSGTFGFRAVDELLRVTRAATTELEGVEEAGTDSILGVEANCYTANDAPILEQAPSGSGDPVKLETENYRYRVCYDTNGVLLSGERVTGSGDTRRSYKIEAVKYLKDLPPDAVRFPGKVIDPPSVLSE